MSISKQDREFFKSWFNYKRLHGLHGHIKERMETDALFDIWIKESNVLDKRDIDLINALAFHDGVSIEWNS